MDKWGEHIDHKFGGCDVPFDGVTEVKSPEEQYHYIKDAFAPVVKAVQTITENIKDFIPAIKQVAETITKWWGASISAYPNKRVVHLAMHGKPRVHKKNVRRIIKWLQEVGNGEI